VTLLSAWCKYKIVVTCTHDGCVRCDIVRSVRNLPALQRNLLLALLRTAALGLEAAGTSRM